MDLEVMVVVFFRRNGVMLVLRVDVSGCDVADRNGISTQGKLAPENLFDKYQIHTKDTVSSRTDNG